MQIQLKQTEIIAALKQFISAQGINLSGKDVSIAFTAGRKEAGITADVSIEDVVIPGFTDADVADALKASEPAVLTLVPAPAAIAAEPVAQADAPVAEAEVTAEPEAAPAKTPTLFG